MHSIKGIAGLGLAIVISMTGCAVVDHQNAKEALAASGAQNTARYEKAIASPTAPRVVEDDGFWVNKRSNAVREDHYPSVFRSSIGVSFSNKSSLKDITSLIAREKGIKVSFSPDAVKDAELPQFNAGFSSTGDLRSLLDRVTAQANMSWRYSNGTIEIFRFETKVFKVAALPGDTTLSATVSNRNTAGAGSSNTSSNSGQDSKSTMKLDFWTGLRNDLKSLVSSNSTYSVSETNASVTVTGTPQVLGVVESYVKNLNALRMRQVVLEVHAYKVDLASGRDFGVSFNSVLSNVGNNLGLTLSTPTTTATNTGTLTIMNVGAAAGAQSAIVTALSTLGQTSIAAESTQMVLSGESASINSLREITYLAEVSSTPNANTTATMTLKPGTVTEGFAMTLTPTVNDDYVLLGGSIDLSTLDSLQTQGSGGQTITTPNRTTGSQLVRVGIRSGETYVYALRQNTANSTDSGLLGTSIAATPLGGQHSSNESKKTLVITITPYIINPKAI